MVAVVEGMGAVEAVAVARSGVNLTAGLTMLYAFEFIVFTLHLHDTHSLTYCAHSTTPFMPYVFIAIYPAHRVLCIVM